MEWETTGRMAYILLGCERSCKHKQYKKNIEVTHSGTRKCDYTFKLWRKSIKGSEWWMVKLICGSKK